jgi:hypothetical protein
MTAQTEQLEEKKLIAGKTHRRNFFPVVNIDINSKGLAKVGTHQIHVVEM